MQRHFKKKSVCFGLLYFYFRSQLKQYIRNNTNAKHVNDNSIFDVVMNYLFFAIILNVLEIYHSINAKFKKL